jgi:holin-like protein
MLGLAILLAFNLLGSVVHDLGVPLPGNVLGLVLLAACLSTGVVKMRWVEQTADLLLQHMLLFFAPMIVGILPMAGDLGRELFPVAVMVVGSLVAVMLATGWSATLLMAALTPRRRPADAR